MSLTHSQKNWLCLIVASPAILLILIAGVAKAYDVIVLNNLENSLTQNVAAITAVKEACNASYEALRGYKQEAKVQLTNTGNPCNGF